MVEVEFNFNGLMKKIQCKYEEKMNDIFKRYAVKSELDVQSLCFLYGGKQLNENLTLEEVTNSNNDPIKILVIEISEPIPDTNQPLVKSKYITCPECCENIRLRFINYKIKLYDCRKKHNFNNILLDEFQNTQVHDFSKVICGNCKNKNKMNSFLNEFYKCFKCDKDLCPLCKSTHDVDQTHNIVNIDKNYVCTKHNEPYSNFCHKCNINICLSCVDEHKGHQKTYFGDIMPNIEEI